MTNLSSSFKTYLRPKKFNGSLQLFFTILCCSSFSGASFADSNKGQISVSMNIVGAKSAEISQPKLSGSRYTWGAAEISLTQAGYAVSKRVAAVDEIYWFTVEVCNKPMLIGVSANSGEVRHTYQTAN